MTQVEELASFVVRARWDDLSTEGSSALKIRVLDSLGCALGAFGGEPVRVRARGLDHAPRGAYSVAGGVARALGMDESQTANAVAMSGAALNALRVTRTGALSHWKGLAAPFAASCATQASFLARRGI